MKISASATQILGRVLYTLLGAAITVNIILRIL
jgi:hypothetical protein